MIPAHFDWLREAACRGIDPGMFFDPNLSHEAKAVCAGCPVTVECRGLADAYETSNGKGHVWGIFGGETPAERITRRKGKRVHGTGEPVMTRFPDLAGSEAAS